MLPNCKEHFLWMGLLFLAACSPRQSFEKTEHPKAPDYSAENYWNALPWKADWADSVPPGCALKENQKNAAVDVFYVHPTMYIIGRNWNGDLADESLNKNCDKCLKFQGSAFNACGKIYAPRYRQAILKSFFDTTDGPKAIDLAYEDVRTAFQYYLDHWNKGRPIILAGHSQGARHVQRLLKDFFDGKELQKQLVAAYPIGMPIAKAAFRYIPLSDSATQTNCFVTWNTFAWGTENTIRNKVYKGAACVNPLTWKTDSTYASETLNEGGLPYSYERIDKGVCDAQIHDGLLWIHTPSASGYYRIRNFYHLSDVNLFYMNLRKNAGDRTAAYLRGTANQGKL
jgi:hypothetical protein